MSLLRRLSKNPAGNEERVLAMAIRAAKRDCDISAVSEFLGSRDQLLIKPKDEREEEFLYQTLGFVLSNYFKETTRALRCLNRAYQISGNFIILETLALTYYQHSIRDAFIEEGSDKIDPARIHTDAIEKLGTHFFEYFQLQMKCGLRNIRKSRITNI